MYSQRNVENREMFHMEIFKYYILQEKRVINAVIARSREIGGYNALKKQS